MEQVTETYEKFSSEWNSGTEVPPITEFIKDDEDRPNQRRKKRVVSNQDCPPSITDTEPKDAYQMPLSDSDSE
ncbi:hypothetical protein ACSBR2_041907 [Camellia fascicularis]